MKKSIISTILFLLLSAPSFADSARLLRDNDEALRARVDLINQAQKEISVEYFIARDDEASLGGLALLREAARRGVRVRILLDSMSHSIPRQFLKILNDEPNFELKVYNQFSIFNPFRSFKRLHDKLLVVDSKIMITGGRNVSNKYYGMSKKGFNDLDILLSGNQAKVAQDYFSKLWETDQVSFPHLYEFHEWELDRSCYGEDNEYQCEQEVKRAKKLIAKAEEKLDQALISAVSGHKNNDTSIAKWIESGEEIDESYFLFDPPNEKKSRKGMAQKLSSLIKERVKEELVIISPYVILNSEARAFLRDLVKNNIKVSILTNSPNSSDNILAQAGYNHDSSIGFMKKIGIRVWEYKGPDTLHAKAAIIDNNSILVGSYNFDPRSGELNREVGLFLTESEGNELATDLKKIVENFKKNSYEVGTEEEKEAKAEFSQFKRGLIGFLSFLSPIFKDQL